MYPTESQGWTPKSAGNGSDCSRAATVFNHNSVLYVLAIISISLKLRMNNGQIPPSFWLSLGKKWANARKKTHFWGEWDREEQGGVQGRTWSGDGTWGGWCRGSHTHLVYSTVPLAWTIQTGSHQQTTYDFSMRAHSGHLSLVTSPMRVERLLPEPFRNKGYRKSLSPPPTPVFVHIIPQMNPFSYCERSMGRPSM